MDLDQVLNEMRQWARAALRGEGGEAIAAELLGVYVRHRPSDDYALFLLGDALRELGRVSEAEEFLQRSLSLAPSKWRSDVMARLAMLKGDHGHLGEAEGWFKRATDDEFGVEKGWIWIMRGANLAAAGRFDEAVACHERAAQLPGDPEEAFLNLGYVFRAQRRFREAKDAFQKALSLNAGYRKARIALLGLEKIFGAMELAASISHLEPDKNDSL